VNTQPPINACKKRRQAIPSSHFITFEDFGWIVGNSETRVSTTLVGFLGARSVLHLELALASPGGFGLAADQPEQRPTGELCRADRRSVGELTMRSVGLEELDGCGMARSRSESTIPCN